jgi:pimeloyl-ACP methyl ester carboxylesterase
VATFVLVHGGFHGGWCWKKVAPLLRAAGHAVYTPTLTGLGERAHLLGPGITLETHAQDVLGVLTHEELSGVILVGHSMAGTVITVVAEGAPERLAHLVYLDASVPRDGESDLDCHPEATRARWAAGPRLGDYAVVPRPSEQPFGVTDAADARWVNAHLLPHPLRAFTDPVRLRHPEAFAARRTFIACTGPDGRSPDEFTRAMAERVRAEAGWRYREMATGHDAMVTAPRELADLLLETADGLATAHSEVDRLRDS